MGGGLLAKLRLACICLALVLLAGSARALPPELEYAKGVVAFSQGQLERAEGHFKAVLAAQPDHQQATYYLGQVSLGQDRPLAAIDLFERVLALSPQKAGIRLDLALALAKAERYGPAEQQLLQAREALGDRASLQYYLGFCRYHLGRYAEALEPLERAQALDDGFAVTAGYYLGLVRYRLGQRAEAARQFERLAASDRGGVGSLARESLAAMATPEQADQERSWGLVGSLGVGYDSNVTLDTDGTEASDAPTSFLSLGAWITPWRREHSAVDLALNLYRTFHLGGAERIGGLNLTDLAAVLQFRHRLDIGHRLELAYLGDVDMLDDLEQATGDAGDGGFGVFMHGHTGQARYRIPVGRASETAIGYRFHAQFFFPHAGGPADRDNFGHELTIRQEVGFVAGRIRLGLELGGLVQDARDRRYDLWGLLAGIDVRVQIAEPLSGWVNLAWRREDHHRSATTPWVPGGSFQPDVAGRRIDDRFMGSLGLTWRFAEALSVGAAYRYLNNDSNGLAEGDGPVAPFRYQRHLFHLVLQGRL